MTCLYETHTPSEVVDLIHWLPDDCQFYASYKGGREHLGWTWDRMLATMTFEQTQMIGFNYVKSHSGKNAKLTPPKPIDWPGRKLAKANKKGSFLPIVRAITATGRAPEINID